MKIFKLLLLTTFLLYSQKINFIDEKAKFIYCQDNIDNIQICGDVRAFVLLYTAFFSKKLYGIGLCTTKDYKNTNSCKEYRFTKKFKFDLEIFLYKYENKKDSYYYNLIKDLKENQNIN